MKRLLCLLLAFTWFTLGVFVPQSLAILNNPKFHYVPEPRMISGSYTTIESDPQYIVMNFSSIIELNWAAPEPEWQSTVKPQILKELNEMLAQLPRGSGDRLLAWSTLNEYMNHPLDEPGPDSVYAIKIRRIFELSRELDLPVFIPLNGYQWWDNLPELYNWWDPDGTHTSTAFFKRQKNPEEFKKRFIAGYDPDNKWNVQWQNWQTPMQPNYRNWGSGEFRIAPPPNLVDHTHPTKLSYRDVLDARLQVILNEIDQQLQLLPEDKKDLFVGLSMGTEISLNASVTPQDEFMPYGYRSIADTLCPDNSEECLKQATPTANLRELRREVLDNHLTELSQMAIKAGIPKQRIYTHVWGEQPPSDPKYSHYAPAAFNLYSRPGVSLYGFVTGAYDSSSWAAAQAAAGGPAWAAAESSASGPDRGLAAVSGTLEAASPTQPPAQLMVLYNWGEHKNTNAIPALRQALTEQPDWGCRLPEILPDQVTSNNQSAPTLTWKYLSDDKRSRFKSLELRLDRGLWADELVFPALATGSASIELDPATTSAQLPAGFKPGVYSWYVLGKGCNDKKFMTSQPLRVVVAAQPETSVPWWVKPFVGSLE